MDRSHWGELESESSEEESSESEEEDEEDKRMSNVFIGFFFQLSILLFLVLIWALF